MFSPRLDAKDVGDKSPLNPDASEVKSFCRSVFTAILVGVGTHTVVLEARAYYPSNQWKGSEEKEYTTVQGAICRQYIHIHAEGMR